MGWSYDANLSEPKNEVRFLIGDTDSTKPQLQDEEIQFLIDSSGSAASAAMSACRALAAKYARRVHEEVGDLRLFSEQMFSHYERLLTAMKLNLTSGNLDALPSAGGVYAAEKETYAANATLVQSSFSRGMHDYE
jgi:hypothetical protein